MRVSLTITDYSYDTVEQTLASRLAGIAAAADDVGVDTIWVADHLVQADPQHGLDEPMIEAYSTLGFLACATQRVRLGAMVSAATYRAPALLVKMVTTIDVLSEGRAWLGIGAGYQQQEARAMGLDLPATSDRFERLEETLQIVTAMFNGDTAQFTGRRYRLEHPINRPAPISKPHPPVLIGGAGERHTLRLVAAYGSACNLFDIPDGGRTLRHKLGVLEEHCERLGRDSNEIDKTVSTRWPSEWSTTQFQGHLQDLERIGISHAVVLRPTPWTVQDVRRLGTVIGAVA